MQSSEASKTSFRQSFRISRWTSTERLVASLFGIGLISLIWYLSFPRFIFSGDDLMTLWQAKYGGYATSIAESLTDQEWGKYRPILNMLLGIEIQLFGSNHAAYEIVDITMESACAILVALLAWRLSCKNVTIGTSAGLMFVFNRFAYFNTSQMLGPLESLSLAFLLASIGFSMRAFYSRSLLPIATANAFFFCAIFTDERYIVAAPFLAVLPFLVTRHARSVNIWMCAAIPISIVSFNVFIKVFVLHMLFLEGTSGLPLGFQPGHIATLLLTAIVNILGFNVGPDYLTGLDINETGGTGYVLGVLYLGFVIATAFFSFRYGRDRRSAALFSAAILVFFFSPFVLSASITTVVHTRWLTAGDTILILLLSFLAGTVSSSKVRSALAVGLAAITIVTTIYYRQGYNSTYLSESNAQMESAVSQIIDQQKAGLRRLTIIDAGGAGASWVLFQGHFVDIYGNQDTPISINFAPSAAEAHVQPGDSVFQALPTSLVNITPTIAAAQPISLKVHKDVYDLINSFSPSRLIDKHHVDTPTGRGILTLILWDEKRTKKSLVLLCGFGYKYPPFKVKAKQFLVIRAADPFPTGAGVRALVEASTGSTHEIIFSRDFSPFGRAQGPNWETFDVLLDRFAGQSVTLTVSAVPRSGDQTAAWLGLWTAEVAE